MTTDAKAIGGDVVKELTAKGGPRTAEIWCRAQPLVDKLADLYRAERVSLEAIDHARILEVGLWRNSYQSSRPEIGHVFSARFDLMEESDPLAVIDWDDVDRIICDAKHAFGPDQPATGNGTRLPRLR